MKKLVREHPALLLGELRQDLERVYAIDETTNERLPIRVIGTEDVCIETLVYYPNDNEYEIVE